MTHLLVAELSWDVGLDADAWLRSYLEERYGAAADAMGEYFAQVEAAGRALFDRAPGNYGDLDVVSRARDGFLTAKDAVSRARAMVGDGSTEAFLTDRLATNAEFAVADTEISYYDLRDEPDQVVDAKQRVHDLVTAHTFDGIIKTSMWTLRRYQDRMSGVPGRELTEWAYDMYRTRDEDLSAPPAGDTYLSDLDWLYGSAALDASLGGGALSINGETYAKGLGTHAYSRVSYGLGGKCNWFTAEIGVDDEVGLVSEVPWDTSSPAEGSGDTWDFRYQESEQVIVGSESGMRAVLGETEQIDSADPVWVESPVVDGDGEKPMVLAFDGDDVVTLPDLTDSDLSPQFAFEAWIYQESHGQQQRILGKGGNLYFRSLSNGRLEASVFNTEGDRALSRSVETIPLNTWTHVGVFYDGEDPEGGLRLFLNGYEVDYAIRDGFSSDEATLDVAGRTLVLGNRNNPNLGFHGLVAYARLATPANAMEEWNTQLFPVVAGSVIFEVWADDTKAFNSGVLTGTMEPQAIDVPVAGAERLTLITLDAYDNGARDHANWANAQVSCEQSAERASS